MKDALPDKNFTRKRTFKHKTIDIEFDFEVSKWMTGLQISKLTTKSKCVDLLYIKSTNYTCNYTKDGAYFPKISYCPSTKNFQFDFIQKDNCSVSKTYYVKSLNKKYHISFHHGHHENPDASQSFYIFVNHDNIYGNDVKPFEDEFFQDHERDVFLSSLEDYGILVSNLVITE